MTGHWQILGGHPGGMGPKKKRKGQYSPFVDYTEPKKWRKKMNTGKGPSGMNFHEHISKLFEQRFSKLFEEYIREAEEEKEEGETTEEQPQEPQEDDSEEGRMARDIAAHQEEDDDEGLVANFIKNTEPEEEKDDDEAEEDSAPAARGKGITSQDLEDKQAHLSKKAEHMDRLLQIISDAYHNLSPEDQEYFTFTKKKGAQAVKRAAKDSDQRGLFNSDLLSYEELVEMLEKGGKLEEFQNEYAQYEKKPSPRVAATLGRGKKTSIYQDTEKLAAKDQKQADDLQKERGESDVDIKKAGRSAGLENKSMDDCEYPELTKQYDMWINAYKKGRIERAANRHRK